VTADRGGGATPSSPRWVDRDRGGRPRWPTAVAAAAARADLRSRGRRGQARAPSPRLVKGIHPSRPSGQNYLRRGGVATPTAVGNRDPPGDGRSRGGDARARQNYRAIFN